MARQVRFTKRANTSFEKILTYLYDKFGQQSVSSFIKRTYAFFDVVAEFPQIGKVVDANRKIFGFVLLKQVIVFYRYTEDEIVIINFFDTRMNPRKRKV